MFVEAGTVFHALYYGQKSLKEFKIIGYLVTAGIIEGKLNLNAVNPVISQGDDVCSHWRDMGMLCCLESEIRSVREYWYYGELRRGERLVEE